MIALLFACHVADTAKPAPAGHALTDNAVHCNCTVNQAGKGCIAAGNCPGPSCACGGVDFLLCLPPDLDASTGDAATQAKLAAMSDADFSAAVEDFCATRAQVIMTDIGAVSEHAVICDGAPMSAFGAQVPVVDVPALFACEAVAYGDGIATSTTQTDACKQPCPTQICINGPSSAHPDENCEAENVFYLDHTLHPDGCHCNQVAAADACDGVESELFCSP